MDDNRKECAHRYVRDDEHPLHHCCQVCGAVKTERTTGTNPAMATPHGVERQEIRNALLDALNNLPADGECAKLIRDTLDRMGSYTPPATLAYGLFFEENDHRVLQYPVRSTAEECERDKALYEPVWRSKLHVHRLVDGGAVAARQPTGKTLLGLPVVIDDTVPPGVAEFHSGRRTERVDIEVEADQEGGA
jgi:hypothetical protein